MLTLDHFIVFIVYFCTVCIAYAFFSYIEGKEDSYLGPNPLYMFASVLWPFLIIGLPFMLAVSAAREIGLRIRAKRDYVEPEIKEPPLQEATKQMDAKKSDVVGSVE